MLSKVPLRKKRNFKNLTLENSPVVVGTPPTSEPNTANDLKNEESSTNTTSTTNTNTTKTSSAQTVNRRGPPDYTQLCEQLSELEIGLEMRLDLRPEDFTSIDELGRGNGGTVCKVLHVRTNTVMAKKVRRSSVRLLYSSSLILSVDIYTRLFTSMPT